MGRECQLKALLLCNGLLRRAFLASDDLEPDWTAEQRKMQSLLALPATPAQNMALDGPVLEAVQSLVKRAAVELVVKMHLSEACVKEVGELQVVALRLFSVFDASQKNMYLEEIRFQLKNQKHMNYRNVLAVKKLLEQRLSGQIGVENFQEDYLAQVIEAREIKHLAQLDDLY